MTDSEDFSLSLAQAAELPASIRRGLFVGLLDNGHARSAEAMISLVPFSFGGYSGPSRSLDIDLFSRIANECSLSALRSALSAVESQCSAPSGSKPDLGSPFSVLLVRRLASRSSNPPDPSALESLDAKIQAMLESPGIALSARMERSFSIPEAESALKSSRLAGAVLTPFAIALGSGDEPLALALAERSMERLPSELFCLPPSGARSPVSDALSSPMAWAESSALCSRIFRAALGRFSGERPNLSPSAIQAALFSGDAELRGELLERFGDEPLRCLRKTRGANVFSSLVDDPSLWRQCSKADEADGSVRLRQSFLRVAISSSSRNYLSHFIVDRLFDPDAALRSAAWSALAQLPENPSERDRKACEDPWSLVLDRASDWTALPLVIARSAQTLDPDFFLLALRKAGPEALLSCQGKRSGLDPSFLMIVAEKGSLEFFGLAMDFLEASGHLDEALSQKAWVIGGSSRKKGDALALCVSLGKLDFAEAILARRPQLWKTTPSKAVVAAMAKAGDSGAAAALSAFESLALSKTSSIAPKATRRASRSL